MTPKLAGHGQFSIRSDVFSFGVLVLEIISGRKHTFFQNGESIKYLPNYVSMNINIHMHMMSNKFNCHK